jgi:hypothetical protein
MGEWAMLPAFAERVAALHISDIPNRLTILLQRLAVLSRRLACRPDFQRRMMALARLMAASGCWYFGSHHASLPKTVPKNDLKHVNAGCCAR